MRKLNGLHYLQFLNKITQDKRLYMEIGTDTGLSLEQVNCDAICVDPQFKFKSNIAHSRKRTLLFQMTSDEFFQEYNIKNMVDNNLDVVFLDGMHQFEFLLRDFINTERISNENTVVLMHDCLPSNSRMAERQFRWVENEDIETRGAWTGDVWKILLILKKYRKDLYCTVLDCPPTGLIMVKGLNNNNETLKRSYFDIINEFNDVTFDSIGADGIYKIFPVMHTS